MAKQKKERECFYHHIISKKWALEQVFLEFSVRASPFLQQRESKLKGPWRTWKRQKIHLDEKSSVLGCTLDGLVCHYQSYSIDWAEDIPGSNIVFSILAEKLLMMKKKSQSWLEAMLLLSSPHFHGKKAIAAFGAAGSLNW